jgi:hypothetical protein
LTLSSLQRRQSWATWIDDRFGDIRHGFENDYVASMSGDDGGFESDVLVIETSPAEPS